MSVTKKLLLKYKFTLLFGLFVILLSLLPASGIPDNQIIRLRGFDKIVHFTMYALLSLTLFFELRCEKRCNRTFFFTGTAILTFSILLEIFQEIFHALERSADILDFLANLAGVITGLLLYKLYRIIKS